MPSQPEITLPEPDYGPPPLPAGFPRWKHFGWDGWHLETPVDWDLGALESGPKGGYFRLDDEFEPRLMVRWQPLKGRFDPERAIERHFKKQRRAAGPGGKLPLLKIGASLPGLRKALKGLQYETYSFQEDDRRSLGLAAFCPECKRAFIAEMTSNVTGGEGERLVKRVLGSLRDHPKGKLARWEVFGLSVDLPASLRAVGNTFNQGYVGLSAAESGVRVDVSRWTLANMHLAEVKLKEFLQRHFLKKRNMPSVTIKDVVVQSHPACIFHTKKRLLESVRARLRKAINVRNPAYRTGFIWHCHTSNRILMFTLGSHKPQDIGTARRMASRLRCCKVIH